MFCDLWWVYGVIYVLGLVFNNNVVKWGVVMWEGLFMLVVDV